MTTPTANDPENHDPVTDLLDSLRGQEDPDQDNDFDELTPTDTDFEALVAMLPAAAFDPMVLAAVDRVVSDSESVGVPTRQRLIAGAERGVRWHRRLTGPLPPLLQEGRRLHGLSVGAISQATELPDAALHAVERGDKGVNELEPQQLAAWIRAVQLSTATALEGLKRSLRLPDASIIYAASRNRTEATEIAEREFYDAVAQELAETETEPPEK